MNLLFWNVDRNKIIVLVDKGIFFNLFLLHLCRQMQHEASNITKEKAKRKLKIEI